MNKKKILILKVLYVAVSLSLLLYTLLSTKGNPDAGILGLFLIGCMTLLSLPSGLIVLLAGFVILLLTSYVIGPGATAPGLNWKLEAAGLVIMWASFLVVGYYQWFILIPRMMAKRRRKDMSGTP